MYEDNEVSASKKRGPQTQWGRMLADAEAKRFDVVVSVDLDRLIRSIQDLTMLIDLGVAVYTVDGKMDLTTADGKFRATMLAAIAEFETTRKGERQVRANEHRMSQGRAFRTRRAFGWEQDAVTVRESEAKWIRWAYEHLVTEGGSIKSVCRKLNDSGVLTASGGVWAGTHVRRMLERPRNAGILMYKGEEQKISNIQPILTREERATLLTVMDSRSGVRVRPGRDEEAWLSGLVECVCGDHMTSKKVRKGKSTPGKYRVYQCGTALRRDTSSVKGHTSVQAHLAEVKVKAMLYVYLSEGHMEAENSEVASTLTELTGKLKQLAEAATELSEDLVSPGVDRAVIREALAANGAEREAVAMEVERLRSSSVQADWLATLLEAGEYSGSSALEFTAWFNALSYEQKRRLARVFRITVQKGGRGWVRCRSW